MKSKRKELNNMELVRKTVEVEKNGEKKRYTNYYILTDNGNYVAVKPAFENDYKTLYVLSKDASKPF